MKKENLGRKIACGVIFIVIILIAIIMIYANNTSNEVEIQNETNIVTNETIKENDPQEAPTTQMPEDVMRIGVDEEEN